MEKNETILWDDWFASQSTENLHMLLEYYQAWLVNLAKRFHAAYYLDSYELGDYIHWSTIALIDSIKRYKKVDGAVFQSFAFNRVRGEVINQINKATEKIAQNHFRKKSTQAERLESIAVNVGDESAFEKLCSVTINMMLGNLLDAELEQTDNSSDILLNSVYNEQLTTRLSSHISKLHDSQKNVIIYHYIHHLKFSEISDLMQLSKGRISQLHFSAISKLRQFFSDSEIEFFT